MAETKNNNLSIIQKIFAVICSAFMLGFAWRVRGNHGFGAKWGMFCVAATLVLFVFALYGNRKKMKYEMIPITAFLAAITAGGWGTLNSQMNGYLSSNAYFAGEDVYQYLEISPYSGLAIMLLLGFGWLPLFAVVLGTLFSDKEYKFKDYIVFIGVYYLTMLISSVSVSHLILSVINPQAVEGAAVGIAHAGFDLSPMKAFIVKFGSASWAKPIPYCRNYFTSIKVISSAIGALASSASVRFVLKDKFTAWFSFGVNLACAAAITAASLVLTLDSDRGFLAGVACPPFLKASDWSVWEFFTGFIFGLIVMLIIASLPKKYTDKECDFEYSSLFENRKVTLIFNSLFTLLFTFGIILARAFCFRFVEMFIDSEALEIVLTVVISAALFVPCYKTARKNIMDKNSAAPIDMAAQSFAAKALPIYVAIIGFIYFFFGEIDKRETVFKYDYSKLITADGFLRYWNSGALLEHIMMITAFVVFFVSYFICLCPKKGKKKI